MHQYYTLGHKQGAVVEEWPSPDNGRAQRYHSLFFGGKKKEGKKWAWQAPDSG